MAQRQHLGSCKSIWTKRERSESDREEGWGICLTILLGRRWPGDNALCFASTTMCLTRAQKLSCWGWMPLWPDSFCVHLVFTWESSWGRRHNGFKCLTCAHATMGGLVLRKEERGETLTCPGGSYWGAVSSGARGTHQRVTLARVPQWLPQHLPVRRGWSTHRLERSFQTWDKMKGK